jgi:hypothetical protein
VERPAQAFGGFLFKRYLKVPGYSFFFSTTCNRASGSLWKTVGASTLAAYDYEHILPLNLDVMLPAFVSGKTSSRAAMTLARILGSAATPIKRLMKQSPTKLAINPCNDWERLSSLFYRHRPWLCMTTDRSPAFLKWRYSESSPNHPVDIWLFRDTSGNEGWFALGNVRRGLHGQVRGQVLLDAVWPRDKIQFADIFPAVLRRVAHCADALFLQPRYGVDYRDCSRWILSRPWGAPRVYALPRAEEGSLSLPSLDLVPADGDSAFRISVWSGAF